MGRFNYTLFGVSFGSDTALELPSAPIGVPLRFELYAISGPWPASKAGPINHEDGDDWVTLRVYSDRSVEMEWGEWLSLWIDPSGQSVGYRVAKERYPTAFEAHIANFAISASLLLQGEELLHSTVVRLRGWGLGFLGSSGLGKSTLTAYLLGRGAELITDDMLRVTEQAGVLYAEPGQPRLKLFEEAAKRHLPASSNKGRWNPMSEKFLFDTGPPSKARSSIPLHALILLAPPGEGENKEISLRSLDGLELFQTLTSSTMNYRLQTKDRLARQFAFAEKLAKNLPIYSLHYPRRHDIFPKVLEAIEDAVLLR